MVSSAGPLFTVSRTLTYQRMMWWHSRQWFKKSNRGSKDIPGEGYAG